jgi:excisionase family DNA binding protein
MNPYEKLEHEKRGWSVRKTASFLGFHYKYVYKLIREGKIEGWHKVDGRIRFCPAELKAWIVKNLNGNGRRRKMADNSETHPRKDGEAGDHAAA